MMLPLPCGRMTLAAALMPRNTPRRCTASVWSHPETSMSSMLPTEPGTPALLNMTSRPPNSRRQVLTALSTSASSDTSVVTKTARSPSSDASRLPRPVSTSASSTLAPSVTNSRAVASPMPLAAPVITARLPSSLPIRCRLSLVRPRPVHHSDFDTVTGRPARVTPFRRAALSAAV
jgi:hypothetical protein